MIWLEDYNKDPEPFDPHTLEVYRKAVEDFRCRCLFDTDDAGADPLAEQEYLAALAHLELAHRHFTMARIHQVRALAAGNGRRYP